MQRYYMIGALILQCKRKIILNITAEPPNFRNVSNRSTYPRIQHTIMHNIPHGWRVASSSDVGRFPKQAQKEISTNTKNHTKSACKLLAISALSDGRIHGRGYGYKVDHQMLPCADKLLIKGTYILWRTHKAKSNVWPILNVKKILTKW